MITPASKRGGPLLFIWSIASIGLSLIACGNRLPPPGGPVDRFPPRIVAIEPESNSVNVDLRAVVRIEFDEEIMPARGREMIHLWPLQSELDTRYRRNAIELRPRGGFLPECTYCIEVSGDVVDLRGNMLGKSLNYCFSTGDSIHVGVVSGSLVYPDSLEGKAMFLATHLPDSLAYRTAVGADGSFIMRHLPMGPYNFVAYIDIDRDERYEPLTDPWVEEWGELGGDGIELELELRGTGPED